MQGPRLPDTPFRDLGSVCDTRRPFLGFFSQPAMPCEAQKKNLVGKGQRDGSVSARHVGVSLSSNPQRPGEKPGLVPADPEAPVLVGTGALGLAGRRPGQNQRAPRAVRRPVSEHQGESCGDCGVRTLFWPLRVCPCSSTHLSVVHTWAETHMHLYTCAHTQENKLHQCQNRRTVSLNTVFGKAQLEMGWGLPGLPTLAPPSSTVTLRASFLD